MVEVVDVVTPAAVVVDRTTVVSGTLDVVVSTSVSAARARLSGTSGAAFEQPAATTTNATSPHIDARWRRKVLDAVEIMRCLSAAADHH